MTLPYTYSFPTDADGWSTPTPSGTWNNGYSAATPSGTSNVMYVSKAAGASDSNTGSQASPFLTIGKALSLKRDNQPDWILLRKGDTWTDEIIHTSLLGKSATEPMLIASYSDTGWSNPANPRGTGTGARPIMEYNGTIKPFNIIWPNANYFALIGLDLICYKRNPNDVRYDSTLTDSVQCFCCFSSLDWGLIEDCRMRYFAFGIDWEIDGTQLPANPTTTVNNLFIRRNTISQNWTSTGGSGNGIFLAGFGYGYDGVTKNSVVLYQNVIDANNWNPNTSVGPAKGNSAYTFFHNIYLTSVAKNGTTWYYNNGPGILDGNIISRDSNGSHSKGGGFYLNNLWARNGAGTDLGASLALNYYADGDIFVEFEYSNVTGYGNSLWGLQDDDVFPVTASGNGGPCTITWGWNTTYSVDDYIEFSGTMPTGASAGTLYFVTSKPTAQSVQIGTTKGGAALTTSGGNTTPNVYLNDNVGTQTIQNCMWINSQINTSLNAGFAVSIEAACKLNVTIQNNVVYKWPYEVGGTNQTFAIKSTYPTAPWTIIGNSVHCGGTCSDDNAGGLNYTYLDNKSLATYAQDLAVGTTSDDLFNYICVHQSKDTWNSNLTAASIIAYFKNNTSATVYGGKGSRGLRYF